MSGRYEEQLCLDLCCCSRNKQGEALCGDFYRTFGNLNFSGLSFVTKFGNKFRLSLQKIFQCAFAL